MKTGLILGKTAKKYIRTIIATITVACSLIAVADVPNQNKILQDIALRRVRIIDSKDADGAVELLDFIEKQSLLSCGGMLGPIDTDSDLVRTIFLSSSFLAESSLDTHWAKLAKTDPEDTEAMKTLLLSGNAGERALALVKLKNTDKQGGFVDALRQMESNDPVVYVGICTRGSTCFNPQQPRYDFYAPLREKSRALLKAWGSDVVDDNAFLDDRGAFGMERLIRLFAKDPPLRNGILQVLYSLDEKSTGAAYLLALESHPLLSAKTLRFLKGHVNKRLRYMSYMGADGMGLQKILDGLPDDMDITPRAPAPIPGLEQFHAKTETVEKQVPEKPVAGSNAMASSGKVSPEANATNKPATAAPVPKQESTGRKRNILVLSLGIVAIGFITGFILHRARKR